ncbi:MAG: helix-turn-helix transcriptional regulator [Chitinophagaceae bacterium]|nr:helix-turn-helix transcriptional regulator [Chitinophagaceae bacterium]
MHPEPIRNLPSSYVGTQDENNLNIDYHNIKKAALVLRSLNHKLRQQIIRIIKNAGKLTVTEIYVNLRLEQSVASQHLAILRKSGIVNTKREGKFIYYTVHDERVEAVKQFVNNLVN